MMTIKIKVVMSCFYLCVWFDWKSQLLPWLDFYFIFNVTQDYNKFINDFDGYLIQCNDTVLIKAMKRNYKYNVSLVW